MKQGGDRQLVALGQPGELADPLGRDADRDGVAAKALVALRPQARVLEEVVGVEAGRRASRTPSSCSASIASRTPADAAGGAVAVVGGAHDRDRERGVGLDRLGEVAGRGGLALAEAEQAPAGLGERRQLRDRVERGGEPSPAALRARRSFRSLWSLSSYLLDHLRRRAHARVHPLDRQHGPLVLAVGRRDSGGDSARRRARRGLDPRRRRCSRPSTASDSKIPGETVVPGDRDPQRLVELARLRTRGARPARPSSRSSVGGVEGLDRRAAPPAPPRAAPPASGVHHLRPGALVVDRRLEQEADQRPELGQRLRLLLGDRAGRAQRARGRPPPPRGPRARAAAAAAST